MGKGMWALSGHVADQGQLDTVELRVRGSGVFCSLVSWSLPFSAEKKGWLNALCCIYLHIKEGSVLEDLISVCAAVFVCVGIP